MALPDNELSSQAITAEFLGGRNLTVSPAHDFETGGIAINDPSGGLLVQIWEAEIIDGSSIVIRNEAGFSVSYYSDTNITEVSLSFDQNMRPTLAVVAGGQAKLIWYDSLLEVEVVTVLASDVLYPRVSLDDKRFLQISLSDVILAYVRNGNLYHRRQRDRYQVEFLLAESVLPEPDYYLNRIGLNTVNRFQFELINNLSQEDLLANLLLSAADPYTDIAPPYQVSATVSTILTANTNSIWGPQPVIIIYALQDPISGEYWVDTEGNLLVHTVEVSWDG